MAHTYARSYALVTLTLSAATTFALDDYITGQTSGAVGIVAGVSGSTVDVYEMSSTAFAPTENVDNVAAHRESCTGTAAYGGSTLPADAAEVIGSDSSVTDIFLQIANISGLGGVTAPSLSQAYIGLEMFVFNGREGQTSDTYSLSFEENVRLGDQGAKGKLRNVSSAANSTSLQLGFHKYEDDDLDNFPPAYVERGSILDIRCANTTANTGVVNDTNSFVYFNASTYKGDGKLNSSNFDNSGEVRFVRSYLINLNGFFSNLGKLYIKDLYAQELIQAVLFLPEVPTYTDGIYQSNSSGCATFFAFASSWEASANNVISHDSNGDLSTDPLLGAGSIAATPAVIIHCVNSLVDVTEFWDVFRGTGTSLKEISFKLTVQDENGNVVEDANVNLENQHAKALFRVTDIHPTALITVSATSITFDAVHGMSVGDSFRLNCEEMKVLTVPTTASVTVSRGQNGTVAFYHYTGTHEKLAVAETGLTDANGQIEYASSGNGKNAIVQETASFRLSQTPITGTHVTYTDFVLKVKKSGYKSASINLDLTGTTGKDLSVRLYPNRFIEQKSGRY